MIPTAETFATSLATAVAPDLRKYLHKKGKSLYDKYLVACTNIFSDFVATTIKKCEYTKNIIYRDEPVALLSQYVGNSFRVDLGNESDKSVMSRTKLETVQAIVVGHAGSGKSMFMRWLSIMLAQDILNHHKIPLYIELRNLSIVLLRDNELLDVIFDAVSTGRTRADFDQFKLGFEYGQFILVLDGIDEVSPRVRDNFLIKLQELVITYPMATIICSTRPDPQVESISTISVLRLNSMTNKQIIDVISRVRFDDEKKKTFINRIKVGSYRKHKDILSNPLLALIMLLTFDHSNDVPEKVTLFYAQIYISLFYKHDASKGIYTRERYTTLDDVVFARVFEWFCFLSYAIDKFRFDDGVLHKLMETSIKKAKARTPIQAYIDDCKRSLSLLQDDGLDTTFVHRSFQEYFTARYLFAYEGEQYCKILDNVALRAHTDNVLSMLLEMGPSSVKRRWVVPRLTQSLQELKAINLSDENSIVSYLTSYYSKISVNKSDSMIKSVTWPSISNTSVLSAALELAAPERRNPILGIFMVPIFGGSANPFERSSRDAGAGVRNFLREIENSFRNSPNGDVLEVPIGPHIRPWVKYSNLPSRLSVLRNYVEATLTKLIREMGDEESYMAQLAETMQKATRH